VNGVITRAVWEGGDGREAERQSRKVVDCDGLVIRAQSLYVALCIMVARAAADAAGDAAADAAWSMALPLG